MQRVHFATRMKVKAFFVVMDSRTISNSGHIRANEIIVFTKQAVEDDDCFFHRMVWWDEEGRRDLVYLTNHLDIEAATVANIYIRRAGKSSHSSKASSKKCGLIHQTEP